MTVSAPAARIWAPGGPETTTLHGGDSAAVTIAEAYAEVELDGLDIKTGSHAVDASAVVAGELTLRNCRVEATGTSTMIRGSIWTESDLSIYDTVIRGGGSPRGFWASGDLIFVRSELSEHVRNETTRYSASHLGGGGYARGDAWVEDSVIRDNVVVASATNRFYTSTVLRGGGLATYCSLTMINSVVENNLLDGHALGQGTIIEGAGLWAAADVSLTDSRVEGNVGIAELDCDYSDCYTYVLGAGVYAGYYGGGELSIAGSTVSGNSLSTVFNGTSYSGTDTMVEVGGGLYAQLSVDCTDDSVIESNEALSGGGLYFNGTTLSSAACSWGDGPTDNVGGDIRGSASGDYGSAATFICEDGTCG